MLNEQELAAVAAILMDQLEVKPEQITPEARLKEDLGADSLDIVEIVMKLEDQFQITIEDEASEGVETVEHIHETLTRLLGRRTSS